MPYFNALTLFVGRQEGHSACKKTEWWGTGVVICLERGAEVHMAQLMPLPLTVSCFSKIQIGFTFLVPAYLGGPGKGPLNGCVCVCFMPYLFTFTFLDTDVKDDMRENKYLTILATSRSVIGSLDT